MVTYDQIKNDKDIKTYIMMADQTLSALGFTEHSLTMLPVRQMLPDGF